MFWLVRIGSIVLALIFCFAIDALAKSGIGGIGEYEQRLFMLSGLYVTLAVSLNLINGITGQFSIGHAAFYQVGAYVTGYLSANYFTAAGIPLLLWLPLMIIVGALGAAMAGLLVGLPSLRLRGDYLAIVTLGFGEIIRIIVQNTEAIGGPYGMNVRPKHNLIWLVWLLAVACIAVCRNLLKTAHGLPFLSVREDEIAASAMGVNVTRAKVVAFLIGSGFAGAAGALYGHFEGFITPLSFAMDVSFVILTMVVLGGTGSITGSVVTAIFLTILPERLRSLKAADGSALIVPGGTVLAGLLATAIAVTIVKRVMDHYHGTITNRWLFYGGGIVAGLVSFFVLSPLLGMIPQVGPKEIEAGNLRMVIFAVTLIVIMLLRPQGIFGHHEFSWTWVKKLFGLEKGPETAVSA